MTGTIEKASTAKTIPVRKPNPPPELPPVLPLILLIIHLRNNSGNAINNANAAPSPYGKGKTICKPILTANDANKKIRYDL